MKFLDLFAGIGGFRLGMEQAGQSRLETLWCNFEPSGQLSLFG